MPYVVYTILGFVIMGQVLYSNPVNIKNDICSSMRTFLIFTEDPLHKLMTKF